MSFTRPPPFPVTTLYTEQQRIPITIPSHLFPPSSEDNQPPPLHPLQPRSHPLLTHPPFQSWQNTLTHSLSLQKTLKTHPFHSDPYELKSIKVNHINYFGCGKKARIGFVSMDAEIRNSSGESLPGVVFLRGGAVAVLVVVEEEEVGGEKEGEGQGKQEQWTILTCQPRIPAGALKFLEIPAGMIDSAGKVTGKAADEIREELGITIDAEKLIDLCALTEQMCKGPEGREDAGTGAAEEKLEVGMYPSAGGSDEYIKLYAYVHRVGKGERIVLRVVRLRDLWRVAARDAKALGAWALWRGLKEAGMV